MSTIQGRRRIGACKSNRWTSFDVNEFHAPSYYPTPLQELRTVPCSLPYPTPALQHQSMHIMDTLDKSTDIEHREKEFRCPLQVWRRAEDRRKHRTSWTCERLRPSSSTARPDPGEASEVPKFGQRASATIEQVPWMEKTCRGGPPSRFFQTVTASGLT
jgi:hypothetical protein